MFITSSHMCTRGITLGHENDTINTVECDNLSNYDIVFDVGVEHLEHFHCILAYHAVTCDGTVALCPFRVR